jgi:hypothetical protein
MADKKISALTGATTPLAGTEVLPIVQGGATVKVAVSNLTAGRAVAVASLASTGNVTVSSGRIGVNTASPDSPLHVVASGVDEIVHLVNNTGNSYVLISDDNNATSVSYGSIGGGNAYIFTAGYTSLYTGTTEKVRIDATGNIIPKVAAKGINFTANTPAAGMTSQLLNWYEEGTWTPTFTFVTPGDFAATYSQQIGSYTRIGNRITVNCTITSTSFTFTTAAGQLRILGLPFTSEATTGNQSHGALATTGVTYTLGYTMVISIVSPNTAFIAFTQSGTAAALGPLTVANFVSGTNVTIRTTITYQI